MKKDFSGMTSSQASAWIADSYKLNSGGWWEALDFIGDSAINKTDRVRLVEHFLLAAPFFDVKPYEKMIAAIGVVSFCNAVIRVSRNLKDPSMVGYYLRHVFFARKLTPREREAAEKALRELSKY